MNKMLPTFRENSSECSLTIVTSMHSMLSLQLKSNLQKETKVRTNMSNEGKYAKVNR